MMVVERPMPNKLLKYSTLGKYEVSVPKNRD